MPPKRRISKVDKNDESINKATSSLPSSDQGNEKKARVKKSSVEVQCATFRSALSKKWVTENDMDVASRCFKVISWNVNGLRALVKNHPTALSDLVRKEDFPDVIFLQETKLQEKHLIDKKMNLKALLTEDGYESYWTCSKAKKGYSGCVAFVRTAVKVEDAAPFETDSQKSQKKKEQTLHNFFQKKKGKNDKVSKSEDENEEKEPSFHLKKIDDKRRLLVDSVEYSIGKQKHDKEGRIITLHFTHLL